jgi:diguanylate cyclase (GGDEF)-like protein
VLCWHLTAEKTPKRIPAYFGPVVPASISTRLRSLYCKPLLRGTPARAAHPVVRATAWILVSMTLCLVAVEAWSRYAAYHKQLAQSAVAAGNVVQAVEEHAEGTMNTVAWLLDGLVERLETHGVDGAARPHLQRYLESRLSRDNSGLQGLFVYDAGGDELVGTSPFPERAGNGDGAYFIHHRGHADRNVHIGPPIVGKAGGEWVITLSRRWNDREGNFAGIALATIPVRYFEQYYARFDVGARGTMLLAMTDGTVVTRHPSGKDVVGSSIVGTPLYEFAQRNGPRGTAMLMTRFDATERLMSYRRVPGYPLLVVAALSKEEFLADWAAMTLQECSAVAVMLLALHALGFRLIGRARRARQLEEALRRAHADLEAKNAALDRLARTDALTGLSNRRYLDERIAAEMARAVREGGCMALVMIDVDHFKRYNDTYGHAAGDDCLRGVASAIGTVANRANDVAARFGGEEFAILLPGTDAEGALRVAEAARHAVCALALPHSENAPGIVTVSAGVASVHPRDAGDTRVLLEAADAALYRAKEGGRNRAGT